VFAKEQQRHADHKKQTLQLQQHINQQVFRSAELDQSITEQRKSLNAIRNGFTKVVADRDNEMVLYLRVGHTMEEEQAQIKETLDAARKQRNNIDEQIELLRNKVVEGMATAEGLMEDQQRLQDTRAKYEAEVKVHQGKLQAIQHQLTEHETKKIQIQISRKHKEHLKRESEDVAARGKVWLRLIARVKELCSTSGFITKRGVYAEWLMDMPRGQVRETLEQIKNVAEEVGMSLYDVFTPEERTHLESLLEDPFQISISAAEHLRNTLALFCDKPAGSISDRHFKLNVSSVGFADVLHACKLEVEQRLKNCVQSLKFHFDGQQQGTVSVSRKGGLRSLADLPKELKQLVDRRIRESHPSIDWDAHGDAAENVKMQEQGEKARETFNKLELKHEEVVACFVDQLDIVASTKLLYNTNDYFPGVSLCVNCKVMEFGVHGSGEKVVVNTSGFSWDGTTCTLAGNKVCHLARTRASDGSQYKKVNPRNRDGAAGVHGRHGGHAGHVSIVADVFVNEEKLEKIQANGGDGGLGQQGGSGAKGAKGVDGIRACADEPDVFAGYQESWAFGSMPTAGEAGGKCGKGGLGGDPGKPGKVLIGKVQCDLGKKVISIGGNPVLVERCAGQKGDNAQIMQTNGMDGEPGTKGRDDVRVMKGTWATPDRPRDGAGGPIQLWCEENGYVCDRERMKQEKEYREYVSQIKDRGKFICGTKSWVGLYAGVFGECMQHCGTLSTNLCHSLCSHFVHRRCAVCSCCRGDSYSSSSSNEYVRG
jgi:hypothetical protein